MPLHHQCHAEEAAGNERDEEVEEHLHHPLVESKAQIMSFRLHDGKDEDGEQRKREKPDGDQGGDADARRRVEDGEPLQVFAAGEPIPYTDDGCRHRGRNRRIQPD